MTFQGMDVSAVEAVSADLKNLAHELDSMIATLDAAVTQAQQHWTGNVSSHFAHQWRSTHRPRLVVAAHDVAGLGSAAHRNALEQMSASGVAGSASGGSVSKGTGPGGSGQHDTARTPGGDGPAELDLLLGWLPLAGASATALISHFNPRDGNGRFVKITSQSGSLWNRLNADNYVANAGQGRAKKMIGAGGSIIDIVSKTNDLVQGKADGATIAGIVGDGISLAGHSKIGEGITVVGQVYDLIASPGSVSEKLAQVPGIGVNTAAIFVPQVAAAKVAWDAGYATGNYLAQTPWMQDNVIQPTIDRSFNAGARAVGGDVHTDPAAAARLVERYEGAGGFFNFLHDSILG